MDGTIFIGRRVPNKVPSSQYHRGKSEDGTRYCRSQAAKCGPPRHGPRKLTFQGRPRFLACVGPKRVVRTLPLLSSDPGGFASNQHLSGTQGLRLQWPVETFFRPLSRLWRTVKPIPRDRARLALPPAHNVKVAKKAY